MKIGKVEIKGYAALAPMAGAADNSFRAVCRQFGASYTVSELVSAKGVVLGDKKSRGLFEFKEEERPIALQIFGDDPKIMAEAAKIAAEYQPDMIDINMGCPAPKVAKSGGGCSLMKNPRLCGEIVYAVSNAVNLPVTVKMRAGWDSENINAPIVARICEENGAAAVAVHARTREQMYAPPINPDVIREVKKAVKIPVIGNGDISDGAGAAKILENTGCDFLMIGRAALGAPWVFQNVGAYLENGRILPVPPLKYRLSVLFRQAEMTISQKGEKLAVMQMRKHAAWYLTGLYGAAALRREAGKICTRDDLISLIKKALEENPDE